MKGWQVSIILSVAFLGVLTQASAQDWIQLNPPTSPPASSFGGMGYHAATQRSVLFVGYGENGASGTWLWDGSIWTPATSLNQPSPRNLYTPPVYDSARNQLVLYGGADPYVGQMTDTWVWNGSQWLNKNAAPPENTPVHRSSFAMAYDARNDKTILYGGLGFDNGAFSLTDTWLWDGTQWSQASPLNNPGARYAHSMTFDAARNEIVLYGGFQGGAPMNDTWVWNGSNWTQKHPVTSPPVEGDTTAPDPLVYDSATQQVVLLRMNGETWGWDGSNWLQITTLPVGRVWPAVTYDQARRQIVVFGGYRSGAIGDTWVMQDTVSQQGAINVTTNNAAATFAITGPATYQGSGMSFIHANAPAGAYTITYGPVSQYIPPSPETKTLTAGGTISFTRPYTPITLSACAVGVVGCSQSISFAVTTGSVGPIAPQGIAVSSNAPSLPFTATASSSGSGQSWLSLLPTTGTAPATLSVSVSPNLTPGTYSAQITIAAQQATNSPQQLSVALTVTAGPPVFVAVRPFVIPAAPAAEPSIAANPKNPMHAVVGFNGRQDGNATCGWAETTDGGQTWTAGVVGFVDGFTAIGDPWLRYSEDGQLFYSCMATKGSLGASVVGVFVARARTGSAAQFEPAAPIETVFRDCSSLIGPCGLNDEIDDHPAIGVLQLATGKRIVACWVNTTTSDSGGTAFLYVGHSPDGKLWLETQVLAGPIVGTCTIGGGQSELAVTWRQIIRGDSGEQTDVVRVSTTRDGLNWTAPQTLGAVGALVNPSKDQSTTARVVSPPYAVSSITSRGLRVIWQARSSGSSQLFYADEGDGWIAKSLLLSTLDHFLPSAGDCRHTLGFYEAVVDSPTLFRYTIWSQDQAGSYSLALLSDILDGQYGDGDSRFLLKRIGDYTGMSCSSKAVWAVWTTPVPPSTTVPAHNEVKGVRLIMPSGTR